MNTSKTLFSDLHTDLWLEIFAYFYADELLHSFLHLSDDIDRIVLTHKHLRLRVRIDDDRSARILSNIEPARITSLSIEEMEDNNIDISEMIALQSVIIKGSNRDRWMEDLLTQMTVLEKIRHISLFLCYDDRGSHLLTLALRVRHLKRLHFLDKSNWSAANDLQPVLSSPVVSLELLDLNFYCPFRYIKRILSYLPNLRTLRVKLLRGDEYSEDAIVPPVFNQLNKVHLSICDLSFDRIISFLRTMPNVKKINIDGNVWGTNVISYFKSEKWHQILDINQRKKRIVVDLDLRQDYSNLSQDNIGPINYDHFETMGLQLTTFTIKGIIHS